MYADPVASLAQQLRPPRLGPAPSDLTERGRQLLDEIESIIVSEGFVKLTIDDLAMRLKCSKSTLYDLAPNREGLVLLVLDRRWRRTGHLLQEQLAVLEDPADKLAAYLTADLHHPKNTSVNFSADLGRHAAARRLFADHLRYSLALLQDIVQEGVDQGRFEPIAPRLVAEVVQTCGLRLQDSELLTTLNMTYEDAIDSLFRLLYGGLVRSPKGRSARTRRA